MEKRVDNPIGKASRKAANQVNPHPPDEAKSSTSQPADNVWSLDYCSAEWPPYSCCFICIYCCPIDFVELSRILFAGAVPAVPIAHALLHQHVGTARRLAQPGIDSQVVTHGIALYETAHTFGFPPFSRMGSLARNALFELNRG